MALARTCVLLAFVLLVIPVVSAAQEAPGGIGVRIGIGDGAAYATVMEILPGGPAARSGIGVGDRLVGIVDEAGSFVDFQGKSVGEVAALVRGPSGSTFRLVVESKGSDERKLYELTRAPPGAETLATPQSPAQAPAATSAPETVRIHFFRESAFVGWALNYRIEHNGRAIGNLSNGSYFSFDAPPGQQSFAAVGNFGRGGTFTFEKGQIYYIELSVVPFSASLQLAPQERGSEVIRSMR